MWNVTAVSNSGSAEQLATVQKHGQTVTTELILDAARGLFPGSTGPDTIGPVKMIEDEAKASRIAALPGCDAIAVWAGLAEAATDREVEVFDDRVLCWTNSTSAPNRISGLAWHDESVVVVPIQADHQTLEVEYVAEPSDLSFKSDVESRFGQPCECYVEWRLYFGRHSTRIQGLSRLDQQKFNLMKGIGHTGVLVMKVVNLFCGRKKQVRDPAYQCRRKKMEEKYVVLAARFPATDSIEEKMTGDTCTIIVHGTRSCAMGILHELEGALDSTVNVVRFEHDTFLPVSVNAHELCEFIKSKVDTRHIRILSHSRGGLVARLVQLWLQDRTIWVQNFGTPHFGTTLVDDCECIVSLMSWSASTFTRGVPILDYATAAFSYFMPDTLPQGLADQNPSSILVELLRGFNERGRLHTYAGVYNPNTESKQFGIGLLSGYSATFGEKDNDLVVTVESALAGGEITKVPNCCHFDYFKHDIVRRVIGTLPDHIRLFELDTKRQDNEATKAPKSQTEIRPVLTIPNLKGKSVADALVDLESESVKIQGLEFGFITKHEVKFKPVWLEPTANPSGNVVWQYPEPYCVEYDIDQPVEIRLQLEGGTADSAAMPRKSTEQG